MRNSADDAWARTGSTGPASDGRIGVTLTAHYDSIYTTNLSNGYTTTFGGTSGSTPMINGLGGLVIQMFTEGMFGYKKTPDWTKRFAYLPRFTTTKCLLVSTSTQIPFSRANRNQQGYGFPNLRALYDERNRLLVIDELDVLKPSQSRSYFLWVPPNTSQFRAIMHHADPAAAPMSTLHRVNSVDLVVKTADGKTYRGVNGLATGLYSSPGGPASDLETLEPVILAKPPAGLVEVMVSATAVRKDGHVETKSLDIDYGLVVRGLGGLRDRTGMTLDVTSSSPGNLAVSLGNLPTGWTEGFTLFSLDVARPVSTGNLLGLEADDLTLSLIMSPVAAGNLFHFRPSGNPALYPNSAFKFPAGLALSLKGVTLNAVALLLGSGPNLMAASDVASVTVK